VTVQKMLSPGPALVPAGDVRLRQVLPFICRSGSAILCRLVMNTCASTLVRRKRYPFSNICQEKGQIPPPRDTRILPLRSVARRGPGLCLYRPQPTVAFASAFAVVVRGLWSPLPLPLPFTLKPVDSLEGLIYFEFPSEISH
jgi:hypothetical protein